MLARLRSQIIGQDSATAAIAGLFDALTTPDAWPRPVVPVVVFGPTGTGKTTLVRAAASAAGVPLLEFDATAHSGTDLRDRVRTAIACELARPGTAPPLRVLLIEHCLHTDPAALLWLVGDSPSVYQAHTNVATPVSRLVLALTTTTTDAKADPLTSINPAIARHITASRCVRLESADAKYVPAIVDGRVASSGLGPGMFSLDDEAAAAGCFRRELGYGPIADSVDTAIARLRTHSTAVVPAAPADPKMVESNQRRSPTKRPSTDTNSASAKRARVNAPNDRKQQQRFTDNLLDEKQRLLRWRSIGVTANQLPTIARLHDAIRAVPLASLSTPACNETLVRTILTTPAVWNFLATRIPSERIPKSVVRDLLLIAHGTRLTRPTSLSGTFSRRILDRVWTKLRLPKS